MTPEPLFGRFTQGVETHSQEMTWRDYVDDARELLFQADRYNHPSPKTELEQRLALLDRAVEHAQQAKALLTGGVKFLLQGGE